MNIEKTMRGKFVNKFSTNLNFKKKDPTPKIMYEKGTNLLNPLKDFIDEISFDLNMGGSHSDSSVKFEQPKVIKENIINNVKNDESSFRIISKIQL